MPKTKSDDIDEIVDDLEGLDDEDLESVEEDPDEAPKKGRTRKAKAAKLGVPAGSLPLGDQGKLIPPVVLSDSTVRNIMAPLRACLATAVKEGLIRSNPAREARLPKRKEELEVNFRVDAHDGVLREGVNNLSGL